MPRLFPKVAQEVGQVLASKTSMMVVWRWNQMKKHFRPVFGFQPEIVTDAEEVAKQNRLGTSLDAICEDVTGGKFCRRASAFHDSSVPSIVAQEHRSMKAALIYEFVDKYENFSGSRRTGRVRERPEDLRSSGAADSPRSRSRHPDVRESDRRLRESLQSQSRDRDRR